VGLYGDVMWRGAAHVSLHRATSIIASGDVREGAQHATVTLAALSDTQRSDRFVRKLAVRPLSTVPGEARGEPAVTELHEPLAAA
jgi:hypothetical protein